VEEAEEDGTRRRGATDVPAESTAAPGPDDLPRSPTGRVPGWVAAGARQPPPEPSHCPPVPRRRRRRRWLLPLLALVVVAVAVWAATTGRMEPLVATPSVPAPPAVASPTTPADHPTPGREAAEEPLGTPAAVAEGSESHRFANSGPEQSFVAYDPCRPVHYVVRPDGAPADADALLAEALARVSHATGLTFVADGPTAEAPSPQRPVFQPDVYGDRWAPVLIAWATEQESPGLAGDILGRAGSTVVGLGDGPRVLVTGQLELDAPQLAEILDRPDGHEIVRAVIQHELAHVVGLAHVDDPSQLMYPETTPGVTDFAAGDLTGLAVLGRGPCVPDL
jgi:hypothetical protein